MSDFALAAAAAEPQFAPEQSWLWRTQNRIGETHCKFNQLRPKRYGQNGLLMVHLFSWLGGGGSNRKVQSERKEGFWKELFRKEEFKREEFNWKQEFERKEDLNGSRMFQRKWVWKENVRKVRKSLNKRKESFETKGGVWMEGMIFEGRKKLEMKN